MEEHNVVPVQTSELTMALDDGAIHTSDLPLNHAPSIIPDDQTFSLVPDGEPRSTLPLGPAT